LTGEQPSVTYPILPPITASTPTRSAQSSAKGAAAKAALHFKPPQEDQFWLHRSPGLRAGLEDGPGRLECPARGGSGSK
jgi:hypothetical protein